MFPVRDDIERTRFPWFNSLMIAICGLVFLVQLSLGPKGNTFIEMLGLIPARLVAPDEPLLVPAQGVVATIFGPAVVDGYRALPPAAGSDWLTLLTCFFLHGGWIHFLGNMWFLYLFGRNVEDRLGTGLFAVLYLGSGLVSSVTHLVSDLASEVPTVGASGAIAGVMGAYLMLFPKARVTAVIPLVVLFPIIELPAWIFLGIWFAIQFFQGVFTVVQVEAGGVAWWAHIGGFVCGFLVAYTLRAVDPNHARYGTPSNSNTAPSS